MTQRTWNVNPFDRLKITMPESPNPGFDYKIDAFVDIKLNFDLLYEAMDAVADGRNAMINDTVGEAEYTVRRTNDEFWNITLPDLIDEQIEE